MFLAPLACAIVVFGLIVMLSLVNLSNEIAQTMLFVTLFVVGFTTSIVIGLLSQNSK